MKQALAQEYQQSIKQHEQILRQEKMNMQYIDKDNLDLSAKLSLNETNNMMQRKQSQKYYLGKMSKYFINK